jgi:glycosyltransferase involved in cell wall biosynthesis
VLDKITPLILTYNEAPNLERTMRHLYWATDIVVVDSFSDDDTAVIAQSFPQTRLFERRFDTHQNQWTFGLTQTDIKTPWVLALDADYVLTDELIEELKSLEPEPSINGYRVQFIYCLGGKPLRSGIYPPVNVLYRASEAIYEQDGHTHRIKINGPVSQLHSTILHDDRKSLRRWFQSQVTYAELEARKLLTSNNKLSLADRIRTWRIFAPVGVVLYCLVWRGGLLDGWRGLFYAFQRAIAELMLSLYLIAATLSRNYKAQLLTEATTPETLPAKN